MIADELRALHARAVHEAAYGTRTEKYDEAEVEFKILLAQAKALEVAMREWAAAFIDPDDKARQSKASGYLLSFCVLHGIHP